MGSGRALTRSDSTGLYRLQTDSNHFTAGSSFRELDDVFLQTQTRIWLGEVLKTRLEEVTSIADLLADGTLLFQVSTVIWKMLLTKFMKLRSSKAFFSKPASGKNSGRYMPYSNVDSFLKICHIMGLTGIDLFCASDVVEKRDTRRVCMCIRSLSKKAISKDLNVPDFDVVTYTLAMPTNKVKGIRKSLEQSQCRSSEDSTGCSTYLVSRLKQKEWGADFLRQYDLYSEESDSSDSSYQVLGLSSPASTTSCGGASLLNLDVENSPGGSSMLEENYHFTQCMFQTDSQDEEIDDGQNNGLYSPSSEAKGSLNAYRLNTDKVQFHLNLEVTPLPIKKCPMKVILNESKGPEASDLVTPCNISGDCLVIDDLILSGTSIKGPIEDARENLINSSLSRYCSSIHIGSISEGSDGTAIMQETKEEKCSEGDTYTLRIINADNDIAHHSGSVVLDPCIQESENHPRRALAFSEIDGSLVQTDQQFLDEHQSKSACEVCKNNEEDIAPITENLEKENINLEPVGRNAGASNHKRPRTGFLKSFAGGVSVIGVFLLLFHLRRPNDREKIKETSTSPTQLRKTNNGKKREQKSRPEGVYPSGNLRF